MLIAYLRERMPLAVFLPLAMALASAAHAGTWPGAAPFGETTALAFLLAAQFRMWDDLADRRHDALTHPDRVLPGSASPAPIVAACVALGVANAAIVGAARGAGPQLAALLALNATLALWYALRGQRSALGDHLVLAKYPAFVLILAGTPVVAAAPARLGLLMAVAYLAACVYEAWHDPAAPAAGRPVLVASEALLLVVFIGILSLGGGS